MAGISYIIPTYNNLGLLKRCLSTLVNQVEKEDRIIVVDDGGSDGTYEYLNEEYGEDNRFLILYQENQGQGPARNLGIDKAATDYIWFIDSDDLLIDHARQKCKKILEDHNLDILFFDYIMKKSEKDEKKVSLNIKHMDKYEFMLTDHFPWNKIFRRELFQEIRFPDEKIRFQDHGTIPELINEATNINYVNESFYLYDLSHDSNISKDEKKYNHMYIACNYLVEYFKKEKDSNRYLELLLINTFLFNRIYSTRKVSWKDRKWEFHEIDKYLNRNVPEWKQSDFVSFKFWMKYRHLQTNTFIKLINVRLFSVSPLTALVLLHPFNSMKTRIKKSFV